MENGKRIHHPCVLLGSRGEVAKRPFRAPQFKSAYSTLLTTRTSRELTRGSNLRYDRRDVVVLFVRAESSNPVHDCGQQILARQFPMLPEQFGQASLAKLFSQFVTGFGNAIGVKREHITGKEYLLSHRAIPVLE